MSVTKKTKLELSDSSGEETDIKVNSSYAESYNRFREKKELLQTLKDRYKGVDQDESSSSSSSEEEDYPEFDNAFFKTLSLLKEKNSKIYDGQTDFFPRMKSKPKPKSKTEKKS
ncbi:unnamed protein product [Lepeophtheirus salmonis]|uniref:(salmon louse) hypothetical protein n=1 Tax=Lepeophtheirus salmonis TaxID=72036 RepID=A0A7R8D0S5_LEPSM|nr:unnamed protein product [Lepeophtheirus salmonis]CAF2986854.1 unnamed protein product [Lepeophtheirus salmonis]